MADENMFDDLILERNKAPIKQVLTPPPAQALQPVAEQEATVEQVVTDQAPVASAPSPEEAPVDEMGVGEAFQHAYKYETLTGFGARIINEPNFNPDPSFAPNMGYYDETFKDIPREFHEMLYEAESQEELDYKSQWLRDRISEQKRFDEINPFGQIGLLLGATILDAPAIAASTITGMGGAAAMTRLGLTGSKITKIVGGAVGAGTSAAIQESLLSTKDPLKNEQTTLLAGLIGFGFGAAGSTVGVKLTDRAIAKAAQKDADALRTKLVQDAMVQTGTDPNTVPSSTPSTALNSTTAMTPIDKLYEVEQGQKEFFHNLGIDITSQLKRSNDPEFQRLGAIMGEDGIYGGNSTMALEFDTTSRPVLADGMRAVNEAYGEWAKTQKIGMVGRIAHRDRLAFNRSVADVVRGVPNGAGDAERKAAAGVQKFFGDMLNVAKASGLRGFENIPDNINYLTRIYSDVGFNKALGAHGKDTVIKTLKGAIMSADKNELTDDIAEKIAKGMYNRTLNKALPQENKFTTVMTNDFKKEMEEILESAELSRDEIDKIVKKLQGGEGSDMNVTKHRINMNEAYVDPDTGLKFTDLLENNIEALMTRYSRSVGGAAAAARFGFETPRKLLDHINKTADEAYATGKMTKLEAMDKRNIALNLANQILGYPNEAHGMFQQVAQTLMDYEFIRTSGGFALASLPEMLITTAQNGFKATVSQVPIARKFFADIRKGIPPNQDIMNVLDSWGVGRDVDLMNSFVRMAEDDALNDTFNKGIQLLNTGKRVAAMASGLPQLTRFSQLLAGKSTIQKFTDMAYKGKPAELTKWMKQLGFKDEQEIENVMAGLKKYTQTHKGVLTGKKVTGLDFEGWRAEDPQAATRFMHSVARAVNHQIQRNLAGEVPAFMSKTWGKLLTQFQTFGVAAYGKKTLNALQRRDLESAVAIGYTTTAAGMIYAARMYVQAQTQDNPQAFLEERLSPEAIVKASIQRSGYASILPAMIDNGLALTQKATGQGRIFNDYARTSGLTTGGIESIPAAQTAKNLFDAAAIPRKAISSEEDVEEKDIRAATNMMPLRRLPALNFMYESFINQFPEKGEEQ